jgi:hypothetical protein
MGGVREIVLTGRYRLLSVVGRGGMGTVWRAHDEVLDREVAVKEIALSPRLSDGERAALCARTIAEARAAAMLDHPGVAAVYDVVEQDHRPWIVMELIKGSSLQEVLDRTGPMPPRRAAAIGRDILSVLTAAHAAGLLHRDVKPGNVLLTAHGRVVLTDFGLAVHRRDAGCLPLEGSPAYISPEVARGAMGQPEPITEASDLWSLGALLYAAVEGRPPYRRDGALPSLLAVLLDEHVPPRKAGPLKPVIEGLLRKDPAARLTARQTAPLLAEIAGHTANKRVMAARIRRTAGAVTAGLLAAGVAVAAVWAVRTPLGSTGSVTVREAGATAGTVTYHETGYTVDIPSGWTQITRPDGIYWQDPGGPRFVRILAAPGDALSGLRSAETKAAKSFTGYQRLRLEDDGVHAGADAELEFRWQGGMRGLEERTDGFDLLFGAPDGRWTPSERVFDSILHTFRAVG